MAITFPVDDVTPAASPRETAPLESRLGTHVAVRASSPDAIETSGIHPVLAAVHIAFAEHRPLLLSPDAIWLTIAQGVAQHVRLHAEALRERLVRHAGTRALTVELAGRPRSAEDWQNVIGGFRALLGEMVGDGRARLLTCDFSTTTPEARVASEIVLMDVYAPYCDFMVACICGIPEVTLAGTPADWRAIRDRIDVIAELDLATWAASLAPIGDQLVATAEGRIDRAFWRDIYKPREAYGWDRVTGWIARLFPYVQAQGAFDLPNPLLAYPLGQLPPDPEGSRVRMYDGPGLIAEDAPRGTSQVRLQLVDRGDGGGDQDVTLEGGLLGVAQDAAGRLEPIAGWIVRPATASMSTIVERLRDEGHRVEELRPTSRRPDGSAEIVALFRTLHAATLFEGARSWRLRPVDQHDLIDVSLPSGRHVHVTRILDLPDGTCVAAARSEPPAFVRLSAEPIRRRPSDESEEELRLIGVASCDTTEPAEEVAVLQGTLSDILQRALDTGGDTDLLATGQTLLDVTPLWLLEPIPTPEDIQRRREEIRARKARRKKGEPLAT